MRKYLKQRTRCTICGRRHLRRFTKRFKAVLDAEYRQVMTRLRTIGIIE